MQIVAHRRASLARRLILAGLLLALPAVTPLAQSIHAYRDVSGQWVFTDRGGSSDSAANGNVRTLPHSPETLHVAVERSEAGAATQLTAVNECLCVITVRVAITESDLPDIPRGKRYSATLEPGARQVIIEAQHDEKARPELQFLWAAALGSPDAAHKPPRPYRAPFTVGTTFRVSQAYPDHMTHTTPDSIYAVDIAMPDGTAVYAAREGTVINVRHDSFRGGTASAMADQANLIEILHDDGTIAVYGHLHWDSIRVRIGQHVSLGEYIADSGNRGSAAVRICISQCGAIAATRTSRYPSSSQDLA